MDDGVRIPLRARDGSVRAYAIVDAADAAWVNQWRWSLNTGGYVHRKEQRGGEQSTIWLHRELLGLPRARDDREGDHKDRDKLNCQRSNLRIVTRAQNAQNVSGRRGRTSQYRGVRLYRPTGRWAASVRVNRKEVHLGYFIDEVEAAEAARAARRRLLPYSVEAGIAS
jgi:hypothetical protein